eukprot:2450076-Prymnesium_polylepis.1
MNPAGAGTSGGMGGIAGGSGGLGGSGEGAQPGRNTPASAHVAGHSSLMRDRGPRFEAREISKDTGQPPSRRTVLIVSASTWQMAANPPK